MKNKKFVVYKAKTITKNGNSIATTDGEPIFTTYYQSCLMRFLNNVTFDVILR